MLRFVFVATAFLFSVSAQADRWVAFDIAGMPNMSGFKGINVLNLNSVSKIEVDCESGIPSMIIGGTQLIFEDEGACEDAWDDIVDLLNEEYGYVKVEVD
jgi:hypothetical protein